MLIMINGHFTIIFSHCNYGMIIGLNQPFWVNYNDLTATSLETMVFIGKSSPFYGPTVQVTELFKFTQMYGICTNVYHIDAPVLKGGDDGPTIW